MPLLAFWVFQFAFADTCSTITSGAMVGRCGSSTTSCTASASATLAVAFLLMYAVKLTGTLRVSRQSEIEGLDVHEHRMVACPEYVIHGFDPSPTSIGGGHTQASIAVVQISPVGTQ